MNWQKKVNFAVTVCDAQGKILEMNEKSCATFAKDGGEKLIGTNLLDCHPEPARSKVAALLASPQTNAYTISKNGQKKLIYQTAWYDDSGKFSGYVELSLVLPENMPHKIRS